MRQNFEKLLLFDSIPLINVRNVAYADCFELIKASQHWKGKRGGAKVQNGDNQFQRLQFLEGGFLRTMVADVHDNYLKYFRVPTLQKWYFRIFYLFVFKFAEMLYFPSSIRKIAEILFFANLRLQKMVGQIFKTFWVQSIDFSVKTFFHSLVPPTLQ